MRGRVRPPDREARRRALDPERSFIVQAPAGAGKTELLTRRFLVLLARVERPEEILAITFTRKAASEMRNRVLRALAGAHAGREPDSEHEAETLAHARRVDQRDRELGWNLADNPSRLQIHTIDGLMASLVAQMPWLSRLGAPPRIAERPEDLYEEAAEGVLAHLEGNDRYAEAVVHVLDHLDNRGADLRELLVDLLGRRDQWVRHRARLDLDAVRSELEEDLRRVVREELTGIREALARYGRLLGGLGSYAASNVPEDHPLVGLRGLEGFPGTAPEEREAWLAVAHLLLTASGSLRKAGGLNRTLGFPPGVQGAEAKGRMGELLGALEADGPACAALGRIRNLPSPSYSEHQWEIVAAVIRVVDLSLTELRAVMGSRGSADFTEVALRALDALGDLQGPSDLLLALDRRLSHILVDEFQDTSHVQYRLVERLTEGWLPGDGRTLFLVGDPMQSIYRFREAEVGLFLRTWKEGLGGLPLDTLALQANFRSAPSVVGWVNEVFPGVFPGEPDVAYGAVPFHPSVPGREDLLGEGVSIRPSLGFDGAAEALEIAACARQALEEGRVAILARSRNHLGEVLRTLDEQGFSYQAQELDPLVARPAIQDLSSLTLALNHAADRLAWLSVLRAPWCGLTLDDLFTLAGECDRPVPELLGDPGHWEGLSEGGRRSLGRAWDVLRRSLAESGRRNLRGWVEAAWTGLGAPAYLAARDLEDAETFLRLLESLDEGGRLRSREALQRRIGRLYASPDPQANENLQVMTIHKAKGLEFDTVLVPGLGRGTRASGQRLLYWMETAREDLLLAPLPPKAAGTRDPIVDYIRFLDGEKQRLELARLLYVAVTRAKRRAVLWAHVVPNAGGPPQPRRGSLLECLWPAVADSFEGLEGVQAESEQTPVAVGGAGVSRIPESWRLPQLRPSVGLGRAPEPEGAEPAPEFEWAGEVARHVGTVAHRLLERIAVEGPEAWDVARVAAQWDWIRSRLTALGVGGADLEAGADRVEEVARCALEDPRGRWILSRRASGSSELPLAGVVGGKVVHRAVDRTFVDEEGTRWIVDFKTGTHEGGDLEGFLRSEVERYRAQLGAYAKLLRSLEPEREVRAALYYPLLKGWQVVDV